MKNVQVKKFKKYKSWNTQIPAAALFLTSEVKEAVGGQKHPLEAKNGMKELIYWKKYLIKVSQQPHKPLGGSNQIWAMTSG